MAAVPAGAVPQDTRRWPTPRVLALLGALVAAALIGTALYMQYVMYLDPCPLCLLQRWFVMLAGALLLVAGLHYPRNFLRPVYGVLAFAAAVGGAIVAGRHVWLQNLPAEEVPTCGPGLEYMLETLPLVSALETVFKGSGECAEVSWRFLGLTIPGWTLVFFVAFAVVALLVTFSARRPPATTV